MHWLWKRIHILLAMVLFTEPSIWDNMALHKPAWTSNSVPSFPAIQAVDGDKTTSANTGSAALPFLAVDLQSNMPVGTIALRFALSE